MDAVADTETPCAFGVEVTKHQKSPMDKWYIDVMMRSAKMALAEQYGAENLWTRV